MNERRICFKFDYVVRIKFDSFNEIYNLTSNNFSHRKSKRLADPKICNEKKSIKNRFDSLKIFNNGFSMLAMQFCFHIFLLIKMQSNRIFIQIEDN